MTGIGAVDESVPLAGVSMSPSEQIPSEHLLAVDVGNSRIKFGLFDAEACDRERTLLPHCLQSAAVSIGDPLPWETIRDWANAYDGRFSVRGIVAGTNPDGVKTVLRTWPSDLGPLPEMICESAALPLAVRVEAPEKVGIDRLLNALAAKRLCPAGCPVLIIDSGTATTVDAVSAEGAFLGGAILPGLELSARALHRYTALLPLISIEELAAVSPEALGRDTRPALLSGLFWGQVGAVRELIARLETYLGAAEQPLLLVTGGGGELLVPHLPDAVWKPHLALQGLCLTH